jgi:hypothetical protein
MWFFLLFAASNIHTNIHIDKQTYIHTYIQTHQGLEVDVVEEHAVDAVYLADLVNQREDKHDPLEQRHLHGDHVVRSHSHTNTQRLGERGEAGHDRQYAVVRHGGVRDQAFRHLRTHGWLCAWWDDDIATFNAYSERPRR